MFELILVKLKYFLLHFQSIINLLHIFNDKLSQIWGCFWRSKWFQASVFLLWSRICLYALWWIFKFRFSKILKISFHHHTLSISIKGLYALWWIFKFSFSKIHNIAYHCHHIKFHHQHHHEKVVMFAYSCSYHSYLLIFAIFTASPWKSCYICFSFFAKVCSCSHEICSLSTKSHFLLVITKHEQQHTTSELGRKRKKSGSFK